MRAHEMALAVLWMARMVHGRRGFSVDSFTERQKLLHDDVLNSGALSEVDALASATSALKPVKALATLLLGDNPVAAYQQLGGSGVRLPKESPRIAIPSPVALHSQKLVSHRTSAPSMSDDLEPMGAKDVELTSSGTAPIEFARNELLDSLLPGEMGFSFTNGERQDANARLEAFVKKFGDQPEAQAGHLTGHWRLVYTDAPDILSIGGGPLADLDFIGQDIDEAKGTCDNVIRYRPNAQVQSLLNNFGQDIGRDRIEQRVMLSFEKQPSSRRVEQKLEGIKVVPLRVLGGRINSDWAPPLQANGPLTLPFGYYEILYNDNYLRIIRTVQGYYAVNVRINEQYSPNIYNPPAELVVNKTILITGANTGMGLESAKRLAKAGAKVILTARTQEKADAAVAEVNAGAPEAHVSGLVLDLGSLESIRSFPERYSSTVSAPLDVLLANAGVMAIPERRTTEDGFERQLGVNHLGHFALVSGMMPVLRNATNGFRIVSVSSSAHRIPNEDSMRAAINANLDPQDYSQWGNYGLSKAANVLFANELQRRFDSAGLRASAVSLHPGGVRTDLGRYLFTDIEAAESGVPQDEAMNPIQKALIEATEPIQKAVILSVEQGSNTHVFLAAAADSDGDFTRDGGQYFEDMKAVKPAEFTDSLDLATRLWEVSEELTGTKIEI